MNQPTLGQSEPPSSAPPEVPLGPPGADAASPPLPRKPDASPAGGGVDADMIEQTRNQIRAIVQEITELCQSEKSLAEFHESFLTRVVAALAGVGGVYWTVTDEGQPALAYEINLPQTGLTKDTDSKEQHARLLHKMIEGGSPQLISPHASSADEEEGGNPTDYLIVSVPLVIEQKVVAVVEVFQRASGGPTTQRGYLRFLAQMADMAVGFLKSQRLRRFGDSQSWWEQLDEFSRHIHVGLDPEQCAFIVANEGRRLIGADRVSIALRQGGTYEIVAVSGVDQVERRSRSVRQLAKLAGVAAAGGETVWYQGDKVDLAPPVEEALDAYIDESPSKNILLLPLAAEMPAPVDDEEPSSDQQGPVPGVMIVEQMGESSLPDKFLQQAEAVAQHSALAITNALEHDQLFLMPLWKTLGKLHSLFHLRSLPKVAMVAGGLLLAMLLLFVFPARFSVEGKGLLQPEQRHEVFAPIDGVVIQIPIDHQSHVQRGDLLLELRNTEVEVALAELIGRRTAVQEQIIASDRILLDGMRRSPDEQIRLEGSQLELLTTLASLNDQIDLYQKKQNDRLVRSPIDGEIVSWHVRENLSHRPVQRGQVLMTVVDLSSKWELEVQLPENRVGHLIAAQQQSDDPLSVEFVLATHPNKTFTGHVVEVSSRSHSNEEQQGVVTVRVAIETDQLPELRPGATVTARILCGRRSLAFVWFHDGWEFFQSKVMFRL